MSFKGLLVSARFEFESENSSNCSYYKDDLNRGDLIIGDLINGDFKDLDISDYYSAPY